MLVAASAAADATLLPFRAVSGICVRELVLLQYCDGPGMPLDSFPKAVEHLRGTAGCGSGANEPLSKRHLVDRRGTLSANLRGLRALTHAQRDVFFAMAMGAKNFTETNEDETSFLDFGGSSSAVAV
jgi:hypothetical protein